MTELAYLRDSIAAPVDTVWSVLTDFERPQIMAPSIDSCTMIGRGVGAIRVVQSSRQLTIHERLVECDPVNRVFRYEILGSGDMPFAQVTSYRCTVILEPTSDALTDIVWRSEGSFTGPIEPIRAFLETLYRHACINIGSYVQAATEVR